MRLFLTARRSPSRLGAVSLGALALAGATLTPLASTAGSPATDDGAAPALLSPAPASARAARPATDEGPSRLVTLDPAALPDAAGRRVGLALADGDVTARVTGVDREPLYTAWTGSLEGVPMSSFTVVRVGGAYRGSVVSPEGVHTLTHAGGESYWLTELAPREMSSEPDAVALDGAASGATAEGVPGLARQARARQRGTAKIGVMFGFTTAAKAAAGGRAGVRSAAALAVSQTNEAFANSGLKVKVRLRGVVKAKGKGQTDTDAVKNVWRLYRPKDGHFDNLMKVRRRHRADIVHLFYADESVALCGAGLMPPAPRFAHRTMGASTSTIQCLPYLVATHELGHNLGADHIKYPGVSHDSRVPYAYGYYNVAGNYMSVMSYYNPCQDAGVYTCVRVPYFSSPGNTYNGQPLSFDKNTDNSRVIRKTAPRVARYVR